MITGLIFSLVLCATVVSFLWRRHRKTGDRRYLCHRCRYDELDLCTRPERPRAETCDIFLLDEEDDLDENAE
jgi:hypothetical protein